MQGGPCFVLVCAEYERKFVFFETRVSQYIKSLCSDSSVWGFILDASCPVTHQPINPTI